MLFNSPGDITGISASAKPEASLVTIASTPCAIALRQSYIEGKLILNPDFAEEIIPQTPIIDNRQFQVGDKVMWTNCYAHLYS